MDERRRAAEGDAETPLTPRVLEGSADPAPVGGPDVPVSARVPEGLAEMPPGPRLAAVLDELDVTRLDGQELIEVVRARYRQVAHEQARLGVAMVEAGLRRPSRPGTIRRDAQPREFAADEVRSALVLTRRAAEDQFWQAHDLLERLPAVHEALDRGRIDLPRARVLASWTRDVTAEQAREIGRRLLPEAGQLTTAELIDRIKELAIALDPEWAARRYKEALRERRVIGYLGPDGTATVSGLDLPADQARAACARLQALARRIKRLGSRRRLQHLQADLFMGLLDGRFTGWTEAQIITHMLDADRPGSADAGADADADADARSGRHDRSSTGSGSTPGCAGNPVPGGGSALGGDGRRGAGSAGARSERRRRHGDAPFGVELQVRLSTLLGWDDFPARIAGSGPINAATAREVAGRQAGAQWRFVVCDDVHGALLHVGLIGPRPRGWPTRRPVRRACVDVQIPLGMLRRLHAHPGLHPEWAPIIAHITDRITRDGSDTGGRRDGDERADTPDGMPDGDAPGGGPPGVGPAGGGRSEGPRRFPDAQTRRHVQVRDQTCAFPGCRMPAAAADVDHVRQWQHGGATSLHNLLALCRHDHRLKDEGGWRVTQTTTTRLLWTSPLGGVYPTRPPPIIQPLPRPAPAARPEPRDSPPHSDADDHPIWWQPARPSAGPQRDDHLPRTTAPEPRRASIDDDPPF